MRNVWIIASVVVAIAICLSIGLTVGFLLKKRKGTGGTVANVSISPVRLANDADLKVKDTSDDIIKIDFLKRENYSVGGNNASVNSFNHDFPTAKLTGWTHTFQLPLRIRKFIVGSIEVAVSKITPISGFTVFNNQDAGDFVTIWHDGDFHHYSKSGELISVGAFPFANGDESIHPRSLKIPSRISEDDHLNVSTTDGIDNERNLEDIGVLIESEEPIVEKTGWARDDLDLDYIFTFVNVLPEMNLGNKDLVFDFSVITLATEDTPFKILQGDDEMVIKKRRIDDVFKKYSCTLTNERSFRPQIRYLLSNFQLEVEDISEFELYVGEFDEPLLMRMKDSSGFKTFVHRGRNKWETPYIPYLDINVLDKHYLLLRGDITTIDFSKKSGHYEFGKYKIKVTEPDSSDRVVQEGFKAYIHTIYYNSEYNSDFASVKVHRFKYDNVGLSGFIRYHSIRKVYVFFWEHDLTKPVYIRACADHGFANYFGYPDYIMQTDVSMFPYFLTLTNFEVNNAVVINLARHESYDFEGGISAHLTRNLITVKSYENSPMQHFSRYVHTLTVRDTNKPFSVLRFVNEINLNVDPTKVSSVEAYYHNKHLKKPLLFIMNGSSKQTFYKLENDNFVLIDRLIVSLEITLKYLAYYNYNYVTIDVSKQSTYHYTGAQIPSSMPDSSMLVSVVKEEISEFIKYSHIIKVNNNPLKFKLMALDGVDISLDAPEVTSVDVYFFNEHKDIPIALVLKGTTDVVYVKKDQFVRKTVGNLDQSLETLRRLTQFNLGIVYLRLDLKSNYYNSHDDGFNIEVSRGDKRQDGFAHYVHTFPSHKEVRFLNGNECFHPKVEAGQYEKADVFFENNFPSIVTLTDTKGACCHFIFQNDGYKKAKAESVDSKLSPGGKTPTQPQAATQEKEQSQTPLLKPASKPIEEQTPKQEEPSHTPLLKPSIKPIEEQTPKQEEQSHTTLLKPSLASTPQVSPLPQVTPPPVPESPVSQSITPPQTESHTPFPKPSPAPTPPVSPLPQVTPPPLPESPVSQSITPPQTETHTTLLLKPVLKPIQDQTPKQEETHTTLLLKPALKPIQDQTPKQEETHTTLLLKPVLKPIQDQTPKQEETHTTLLLKPALKPIEDQTPKQEEPSHTPLLKPSIKPIEEQTPKQEEQSHTTLLKPSLASTPQVSPLPQVTPPPVPESPVSQSITPPQTESHTPFPKPSPAPTPPVSPLPQVTPPPVPVSPASQPQSSTPSQPESQTSLLRPSLSTKHEQIQSHTPPPLPKAPPSLDHTQEQTQSQTQLIKLSQPQVDTQSQTKLIKPSQPQAETPALSHTKLIKPSQPQAESQSHTPPPVPKLPGESNDSD
ncbi:conserved hypothetical protein [Theileria orientalis strain Shintoku]|uniref:Uncharacterized protein n=1 Tax=Theileria orientalis strain Shintoku TaxID=869250 RepID=J4CD94_THEOR|nr:conserved hypothetical protein [Theileria orientalis strain Shintoku]BAM40747.1 conserved hypothetical protein [Theileria orientalis strain Shintoku]|eukprot:XP_009691048.1 conserved hypothetical protein [Theileria orientalis strain Shintoku]